ncbi:MAG: transcription-repair coupling factor [Oscillospiraceae bacterium]|jgi:transcription-repair coupling factor (superfamily II helicase)|nr:transcription-repair coupling factor [Oscillospiraceae bacterium]
MRQLLHEIIRGKELRRVLNCLDPGKVSLVSGLNTIHKVHLAAALYREAERPVVLISDDDFEARRIAADITALTGKDALMLTAREFTFFETASVSRDAEHVRLNVLHNMQSDPACLIVATPDGLMQRTMPPEFLRGSALTLKFGEKHSPDDICAKLAACGYVRTEQVEGTGQFARRGGILDFFSPAFKFPVRCEFFGNEIDSLSLFDVTTQRRTDSINEVSILPAGETRVISDADFIAGLRGLLKKFAKKKNDVFKTKLSGDIERLENGLPVSSPDCYLDIIYGSAINSAADFIPENAVVVISEPVRCGERGKNYQWQIAQEIEHLLEQGEIDGSIANYVQPWAACIYEFTKFKRAVVMCVGFKTGEYPLAHHMEFNPVARQLPSYNGSLPTAVDDIRQNLSKGYRVVVLAGDERRADALRQYLDEQGIKALADANLDELPDYGNCSIAVRAVSTGAEYPNIKLAIITDGQFVARAGGYKITKRKQSKSKLALESYNDLSPGDLVVHEVHGIGRFVGLVKINTDGADKEYIRIDYAGSDKVYVPATQLDLVGKYIGGSGEDAQSRMKLSKLGGAEWTKAKAKARAAAKDMADELIKLYAKRTHSPGYRFIEDSGLMLEFEASFPYNETDDQLRAIADIKHDMEKPIPMDRLLCGDVGFGKTEVALRAVMKCLLGTTQGGKQAAILAPTTVLAKQHFETASKRFANLPVNIRLLSRFNSAAEVTQILKEIRSGACDIVIGTHKLLSKQIIFRDLGLLVVDEEQRFGVTHKERLKQIATQVDVLTLSATPIPRTLNMALAGIRDLSTIEEPPPGRSPVQTYVLEHDWGVLREAISREVTRGGQVYYLHNRTETIDDAASKLRAMFNGDVAVDTAHGQMDQRTLSQVMERVTAGEVQVLVCTTIIETGIDIPNVNTIIVEDADRLGLAQLHQIRGRVGRSQRRAFAYFTFKTGKSLTEVAMKRLNTIREFAAFNSGVKIAMRDLEIRGAGNLLGSEQSGHMSSVGFDMYLRLLEEAVQEGKGETVTRKTPCSADLSVDASIPESYVKSPEERMDIYRRIALIEDAADESEIVDELIDRYGEPPSEVLELISIALLRGEAANANIVDIKQSSGMIQFKLSGLDGARLTAIMQNPGFKGKIKVARGLDAPYINLKLDGKSGVIEQTQKFVRAFS